MFDDAAIVLKRELVFIPIVGWAMARAGNITVARGDGAKALRGLIRQAQDRVKAGRSILIFPEGTRSKTGEMLPFKKGGFIMAIKAQVPVVPVAVHGGRAAMRKGSPWVRPVMVDIVVGEPIPTTGLTLDDRDELIARVRAEVERLRASVN